MVENEVKKIERDEVLLKYIYILKVLNNNQYPKDDEQNVEYLCPY